MKRFILLLTGLLITIGNICAQTANRRGFFVELEGGAALGKVMHTTYYQLIGYSSPSEEYIGEWMQKGGFVANLDFGYRFRVSKPMALEVKVGAGTNFKKAGWLWNIRIMPGLRWTSKDFANNKSIFLSLNSGIQCGDSFCNMFVPIEIGVGMNITPKFYAGLYFDYSVLVWTDSSWSEYNGDIKEYHEPTSYGVLGLRLGYRF